MTNEQYAALVAQQNRLLEGLKAINEERTRRGMLPTCMFKVLAPEIGVFNEPIRGPKASPKRRQVNDRFR